MKSARIHDYGGKEAVVIEDIDKPTPVSDKILVEVYAASVNPFDLKVRDGAYKENMPVNFPITPGGDFAGVISEIGESVSGFSVGQPVYGQANALGQGSFAEFTLVSPSQLAQKPGSLDFTNSAALPLVCVSAYQAIIEHINLQPRQMILIHGGGGGIGSVAIQLAKDIGAYVATTVSSSDIDYVKQLGADEVINYETEDFAGMIHDYDAVFDTVGGEITEKSYEVLKPNGTLVSMVNPPDPRLVDKYKVNFIHQSTKVTTDKLNKIGELIDSKKLRIRIAKVFDLNEAAEAMETLKTTHPKGKIVIQVKAS